MEKFDEKLYLVDMYRDPYYPDFLVNKVKGLIVEVVNYLETGEQDMDQIQAKFDVMTIGINDLEEEFGQNGSEIETVARDSIGQTVIDILKHYQIDIDVEEAIRERDW